MPVLEVEDLTAGYAGSPVLLGVSLAVDAGEIVSVVGPNGAGKSTLLKSITGFLNPRSGSIRFMGTDITNEPPERLVHMGMAYVPQVENVFPSLTVRENLELIFPARAPSAQVRAAIEDVCEMFPNLKNRLTQRARNLSGGERQMLAIARSIVSRPKLLVMDEPTAALAPAAAQAIFEHIVSINASGIPVLLVEQNAARALAISHRGYILDGGRNALTGRGSELLKDPEVGRLYLGRRRSPQDDGGTPQNVGGAEG